MTKIVTPMKTSLARPFMVTEKVYLVITTILIIIHQ